MNIRPGNVFWISPNESNGIASDYSHPHVVLQANPSQADSSNTVVVCALTSNLKRAKEPGNVLLDEGEAGLARQSVVVVSQASKVDKTQLGEYIGTLAEQRINQVLAGMRFLQEMTRRDE
jgi:mRNA interferase MazF